MDRCDSGALIAGERNLHALRLSVALAAAAALSGCAAGGEGTYSYSWQKEGAGPAERQRDLYQCEADMRAGAASFGGGVGGAAQAEAFGQRCMVAKGWTLQSDR